MKKILFIVLDGAADKERSAYKFANKPFLNKFVANGVGGLINNELGSHPDSAISNWCLLGYTKDEYPGRGLFEALGIGITPKKGEVYVRGNFATVKEVVEKTAQGEFCPRLQVIDRRAGRDETGLEEIVKDISHNNELTNIDGIKFEVHKSVGHRVVIIMKGNTSADISDSDPGESEADVQYIKALNRTSAALHTARALNKWSMEVYKFLKTHPINRRREIKANFILTRGSGSYKFIKPFKIKTGMKGAVVAGSPVIKGIGAAMGMDVINVDGATAMLRTNLAGKVKAAISALANHDFVLLHVLAPDIAAHDKILNKKIKILEQIDNVWFKEIAENVDFSKTVLVVTSDHITDVWTGQHTAGTMPFLIYTDDIEKNGIISFNEESCKFGPEIDIEDFFEEVQRFI